MHAVDSIREERVDPIKEISYGISSVYLGVMPSHVEVHEIDIDPIAFLPVEEVVAFSFTRIKTREIGRSERAAGRPAGTPKDESTIWNVTTFHLEFWWLEFHELRTFYIEVEMSTYIVFLKSIPHNMFHLTSRRTCLQANPNWFTLNSSIPCTLLNPTAIKPTPLTSHQPTFDDEPTRFENGSCMLVLRRMTRKCFEDDTQMCFWNPLSDWPWWNLDLQISGSIQLHHLNLT